MNNCSTFFIYNTPPEKLYGKNVLICDCARVKMSYKSGSRIFSDLPKNIELVQMIVFAALNSLALSLTSIPTLSIILIAPTVVFIGYKFYKSLFCTDPLIETFYKICGSKEKF